MQQIETGSAQKRIKRVYVNPPAASVEEFLENLIMYYSKTSSTTSPEVDA
jgi:hypothetical protein